MPYSKGELASHSGSTKLSFLSCLILSVSIGGPFNGCDMGPE